MLVFNCIYPCLWNRLEKIIFRVNKIRIPFKNQIFNKIRYFIKSDLRIHKLSQWINRKILLMDLSSRTGFSSLNFNYWQIYSATNDTERYQLFSGGFRFHEHNFGWIPIFEIREKIAKLVSNIVPNFWKGFLSTFGSG